MENQISVKLSSDQNLIVGQLAEKFRCSRAEAVRKAIELASDDSSHHLEAKIDELQSSSIEILRLLQRHSDQSSATSKNIRLWVQQAVF